MMKSVVLTGLMALFPAGQTIASKDAGATDNIGKTEQKTQQADMSMPCEDSRYSRWLKPHVASALVSRGVLTWGSASEMRFCAVPMPLNMFLPEVNMAGKVALLNFLQRYPEGQYIGIGSVDRSGPIEFNAWLAMQRAASACRSAENGAGSKTCLKIAMPLDLAWAPPHMARFIGVAVINRVAATPDTDTRNMKGEE
jgi:hypothetical protein